MTVTTIERKEADVLRIRGNRDCTWCRETIRDYPFTQWHLDEENPDNCNIMCSRCLQLLKRGIKNAPKPKPDIDYNPHNGTWDIGWRDQADNDFTPFISGYTTKEEAESDLANFDKLVRESMTAEEKT
jgi:hypothetical protein